MGYAAWPMKLTERLPEIPAAEQTPLVKQLVVIIALLVERVAQLEGQVAELRDEIAVLKGRKPRPKIQPSRLEEPPDAPAGGTGAPPEPKVKRLRRPRKTVALVSPAERVIHPERVPAGSRFLGYDDDGVQDLRIELHHTRFRLARWHTPEGASLQGQLPEEAQGHHFGPHRRSYMLYQYYHQHVTQPLLHEQRHAFGVDISSGPLARLLTEGHTACHAETDAVRRAGLEVATYLKVDDTSARHPGKHGYCLYVGSQSFAWDRSALVKDRLSVIITVLGSAAPCPDYRIDAVAVEYLHTRGASQGLIDRCTYQAVTSLPDEAAWEAYLKARLIVAAEEVRRVTEAARLASLVAQGWREQTVILSDGAGSSLSCALPCAGCMLSVPCGTWCRRDRSSVRRRPGCSMRSGSTTEP